MGERRPLLFIPGLMGSRMWHKGRGEFSWGTLASLYRSRNRHRVQDYYLPLEPCSPENPNEPAGLWTKIRALPPFWTVHIYDRLMHTLTARCGHRLGDLRQPRKGETLFPLPYDWRRSHIETASRLDEAIERLRDALGPASFPIDIIVHSTGGIILDYYLRSPTPSSTPSGEGADSAPLLSRRLQNFSQLLYVGCPLLGTFHALKDLLQGVRLAPLGRRFEPALLFSFPSIFETLPFWPDLFHNGTDWERLDLFDPQTWIRNRWSVFSPEEWPWTRQVHAAGDESDESLRARLERHLGIQLRRALGFLERIKAAPAWPEVKTTIIGDCARPTCRALLVERKHGSLRPRVPPHWRLPAALREALFMAGDGNATRYSALRGLREEELPAHVEVSWHHAVHRYLLASRSLLEDLARRLTNQAVPHQFNGS